MAVQIYFDVKVRLRSSKLFACYMQCFRHLGDVLFYQRIFKRNTYQFIKILVFLLHLHIKEKIISSHYRLMLNGIRSQI